MAVTQKRTLFEVLTGRNKQPPTELQFFNPLQARIGWIATFQHEPELVGIEFPVEKIWVVETVVRGRKYLHAEYGLKEVSTSLGKPLRFKLRVTPDEDAPNDIKCRLQLFFLTDEQNWDQGLYDYCCRPVCYENGQPTDLCFVVQQDDEGKPLETPRKYWRIGETARNPLSDPVLDPWHGKVTLLSDPNHDGKVDNSEMDRYSITYWDFSRITHNDRDQQITEYFEVTLKDATRYFQMHRGTDIDAFQVSMGPPMLVN